MHIRPRAEVIVFKGMNVLADITGSYVVFPGGGIEMHETPIEAAQRECQEEAGRRVINLTPAHKGTLQFLSKDFSKGNRWAKDFVGGYSHWFTGSSSDEPLTTGAKKHKDYQPGFDYHPVKEVLAKLKHELGGDWAEEVAARCAILQAHLCAHSERKVSSIIPSLSPFPPLQAVVTRG